MMSMNELTPMAAGIPIILVLMNRKDFVKAHFSRRLDIMITVAEGTVATWAILFSWNAGIHILLIPIIAIAAMFATQAFVNIGIKVKRGIFGSWATESEATGWHYGWEL